MKKKKIIIIILLCSVGVVSAFFAFKFLPSNKIEPGIAETGQEPVYAPDNIDQTSVLTITEWYEAVGTVRPRTESSIEAQVTAQILDVRVRPGNKVQKGQVLVTLDNRQFLSRLDQSKQGLKTAIAGKEQARQTVIAAKAAFAQAQANYKRIKTIFKSHAATSHDLEKSESAYLQAKAGLTRAQEALSGTEAGIKHAQEVIKEAEIGLGYTEIKAPESGEVLKRLVEPGNLALPGKPLVILQITGSLRLEAYVREGLIRKVKPGAELQVAITTLNETANAKVEEIIPYADPQTRTFLVKVSLPHITGLYPGMFGKLLIPVQEHQVVAIPGKAVRNVGQLELVSIREKNTWKTRFVKTGKKIGDKVEVLSGLSGNEIIGY
ncbi:MAG: efflux RND transporter periplasmic adaptor subunit [Desulfobacteraceae bacterium]|nr:efflux RND transporter periplasmic adaptor subunit [Desulfobacteraceae bacterium]